MKTYNRTSLNINKRSESVGESEEFFSFRHKDSINPSSTKRLNFRLNYNPYNLKKSIEQNHDNKQLKLIRNLALGSKDKSISYNQFKNNPSNNLSNSLDKIDKLSNDTEKGK